MKRFKIGQIGIWHNHAQGHMETFKCRVGIYGYELTLQKLLL